MKTRITVLEENPMSTVRLLRGAAGKMGVGGERMVVSRGKRTANHILVGRSDSREIYPG